MEKKVRSSSPEEILQLFDDHYLTNIDTKEETDMASLMHSVLYLEKDGFDFKLHTSRWGGEEFVRGDLIHPDLPLDKVNKLSTAFNYGKDSNIKNWETLYEDIVNNNAYLKLESNSIFIFDRYRLQRFLNLDKVMANFKKTVYKYFTDNNIKVIFQLAIGEPLNYLINSYGPYEWFFEHDRREFKHIIITDCPLFESKENCYYLKLGHLLEFYKVSLSLERDGYISGLTPLPGKIKIADLRNKHEWNFYHTDEKRYIFFFGTFNPLPHRIYFLNKLLENKIRSGYVNLCREKYESMQKSWPLNSDGPNCQEFQRGGLQNKYFWQGYTKENYNTEWEDFYNNVVTSRYYYNNLQDGERYFKVNHSNREYNKSYIDIFFETHIVANIGFNNFTEKSIIPIYSEKFFILVGSNRFYKLAKEIGINTFLELFGLEGFDEIDNPYEQTDEVIKFLLRIDKGTIKDMFISHKEVFKENKRKLIEYFHSELLPIQEFILSE